MLCFSKHLSFYNELYTVRLGAISVPFWHREGYRAALPAVVRGRGWGGGATVQRCRPSCPSQAEPSWRRPARHIFQKHNVLQWILHFYTPFTKHQFLRWIWRRCYKNIHFYNEFDCPLQIISKSCKNTIFYNEFCTWFKNLIFYIELCTCL